MDVINQLITSYNWVAPPCRVCRKHWILLLSSLRSCKCILATPSLCLLPTITLALRGPIWHDGVLSSLLIWDHWGSRAEWSTRFLMNHVQNTDQWDGLPFATMPHLWYISHWRLLAIVRCEPLGFLVCHSLGTACPVAAPCCACSPPRWPSCWHPEARGCHIFGSRMLDYHWDWGEDAWWVEHLEPSQFLTSLHVK